VSQSQFFFQFAVLMSVVQFAKIFYFFREDEKGLFNSTVLVACEGAP
jgi:hypothetical protein